MVPARSTTRMRPVVVVVLVVFAFWRPLLAGDSLGPDDQQWLSDPFNANPPQGLTPDLAERDAATVHAEWVAWGETIRSGEWAWWTDAGGGQPLFDNALPITHLAYLFTPGWYAAGLAAALAVLLAALGAMRLSDEQGLAPLAGLFAGIVFGFSGVMFVWAGWPHATAIALTPWVLVTLLRVADGPSVRRVGIAAAVIVAQLWCGVFAIAALSLLCGATWGLVRSRRRSHRSGVIAVLASVGLGAAVAAPLLWPRWERWSWADTSHVRATEDSTASVAALATTVVGNALGNPAVSFGWMASSSFQLSVMFVGLSTVGLALLGLLARPRPAAPVLFVGCGVAVAYVGGPFASLSAIVIGGVAEATHARVLISLGLALLSAHGAHVMLDPATTSTALRRRLQTATARLVALGIVGVGAGVGWLWLEQVRGRGVVRDVLAQAFGPALVGIVVVALLGSWLRRSLSAPAVLLALTMVAVYELLTFGMPIPTVTAGSERPVATDAHLALQELVGQTGRIAGDHDAFSPFVSAGYGLSDVRAPDLRSTGEIAALEAVDPISIRGASGGNPFAPVFQIDDGVVRFDHPTWDLLGVDAWVMPRDGEPPGPRVDPASSSGRVDAARAPSTGEVTIPEHGLWGIVIDARFPVFTRVAVAVSVGDERVENELVVAGARNGPVVVPILGDHLPGGAFADVSVVLEPGDGRPASLGVDGEMLSLGTVGARTDVALVWVEDAVILDRATPRAAPVGPGDAALLIRDGEGRLDVTVTADEPVTIRTDIIAEPGWRVRVDGRTTEPVVIDGVVLGIDVAAGTTEIVIDYRPPRLSSGVLLAMLAIVGWAVALVIERRRNTPLA